MKQMSLGNRILSVILALVMVIGMCPLAAVSAADGTAGNSVPGTEQSEKGEKLSFQKVNGVDADLTLPQTKVDQKEESVPYADTDVVRVSIVLTKEATLARYSAADVASNSEAMAYRERLQKD